jgi:DNA-binding NarL/FixJ family response regulator
MKTEGAPLSVLIADDSSVIRERLGDLLRDVPGVSVVAESEDVPGTLDAIRRLHPAAVVLDVSMPGGSGLDVLRQMGKEGLSAAVIVLTNYPFPEYEKEAREQGACAFLNKTSEFMKVAELLHDLSAEVHCMSRGKKGTAA